MITVRYGECRCRQKNRFVLNAVCHKRYVTHPELVRPELIDVGSFSGNRLIPEAELQQKLIPAGQQHLSSLLPVGSELLARSDEQSIGLLQLFSNNTAINGNGSMLATLFCLSLFITSVRAGYPPL